MIKDVLLRFSLSLNRLRGQRYDGASSMSGAKTGVAIQILAEEPKAIYTHCYGHALNLACSDAVKKCKLMINTLDVTYEITKLLKSHLTDLKILNWNFLLIHQALECYVQRDGQLERMHCRKLHGFARYLGRMHCIAWDTGTKVKIKGVKSQMHTFE